MKKRKLACVVVFMFIGSLVLNAQNEKVKALFLYNFIKNIEWPQSYYQGDMVIGVLGNSSMKSELENITSTQHSGTQVIKVKLLTSLDEVSNCHVIYVSSNKTNQIAQITSKLNNHSTLVVSDGRGGITQGASINFTTLDDRLKFEICKQNIEQRGMKVSSALVKMGIEVI